MQRAWPTGSCRWGTPSSSRKRSILTTSRVYGAIEFRLDKNEPNHLAASNTSTAFFRHVIVLQSISDISELSGLAKWLLLPGCGNILHSRILWALTATKDTDNGDPQQITDKSQQLLQTSRLMIAAQHDGSALRQTRIFSLLFEKSKVKILRFQRIRTCRIKSRRVSPTSDRCRISSRWFSHVLFHMWIRSLNAAIKHASGLFAEIAEY